MFDEHIQSEIKDSPNVTITGGDSDVENRDKSRSPRKNVGQDAGAEPSLELTAQAQWLREMLQQCKSLTERACDTAVREARRCAQVEELAGAELSNVKLLLIEKDQALNTRDRALCEQEATNKEKIDSLQTLLRDKELQLESCQTRGRAMLEEIDGLNLRLDEAASAMKQAETRFREFAEHQESKIYELRGEVRAKDDSLQAKDSAFKHLEEQSRVAILALERLLQNATIDLENKAIELREKETALRAVADRDKAVTQLLQQLAEESQKLMTELREKNQLIADMENKTHPSFDPNSIACHNEVAVH